MEKVYVLAIDPGDKHVGFAKWRTGEHGICCWEEDALTSLTEVSQRLVEALPARRVLVVETFQLYGDKAMAQVGSEMETSQMIGALKYIAGQAGVEFVGQGALIKKATRAQLRARDIQLRGSIHAKDAGLHCAYYVLFNELGLR